MYRAGDKVIVVDNKWIGFVKDMRQYIGHEATIMRAERQGFGANGYVYKIDLDNMQFGWIDECFNDAFVISKSLKESLDLIL